MASAASKLRIALVTGANKGIGYSIAKALLALPSTHVLVGARDQARGEEAVASLGKGTIGDASGVSFQQIDISDEKSITAAAAEVKEKFGALDILVNNAAIAFKGDAFDEHVARDTIGTNYFGTKNVCNAFFPLLRPNGRVVHVSSTAGTNALARCSAELQAKFLKDDLTISELDALMNQFIDDVKAGKSDERGWPHTTYGVSKLGVNMLTRIQARDNKVEGLLINACCPGYVKTDMSSHKGHKTPDEGAITPVLLATLGADQPTGRFWSDGATRDWK